ncbi:MAG TPA: SLC13 family permease [Oleiagrimonas sp.]|nr:SLC13 family permease [Oleiagrimonas sp.]
MVTFADLGFHAWLTIGVVGVMFACLLWERVSPDVALLGAVAILLVGGVLTPGDAVAGFSNTAVLTVVVLYVVVGALRSTGAIRWVASWVLGRPHGAFVAQARLVGISSSLSAFINNTPVVAMMTAAVEQWCRRSKVPVSKLLIPLSYATILGGMCSLIGTSTNLIVMGLMKQHPNLPTLHMFDPAWVGVPAAIVGLIYLLTIGRWLLPDRRTALDQARETREYVLEMRVKPDGKLVGHNLVDAGLRSLSGAFLVEIQRDGVVLPAVTPDTVLQMSDRLVFVGTADGLRDLRQMSSLAHVDDQVFKVGGENGRHFVEAVPSRLSPVVGKTVRAARFRERYGAVVVAVNRRGKQLASKPGDIVLQAGDTLLLETTSEFTREFGQSREFMMVNLVDDTPSVQPRKAMVSLGILGAFIIANAVFHVDIFVSALVAMLAVMAAGCINFRDARRSVDFPLYIAIACALAIGLALSKTGVASAVAHVLLGLGRGDPFWTLLMVYVLTVLFTEVLTNNAAAVLMFPIGLAASQQLGANPMPFIITVMIGASASFITPIGYQTNMMVYGPGGYRFLDFTRVGVPLAILVGVVVMLVVPQVWPF